MVERTSGIILRLYALTETSLIVHWITSDFGRLVTVAKGARRLKSSFHGKLDLYYEADLSFSRSRRSEIHTLREVNLIDSHSSLRRHVSLLQQVAYCSALVEMNTESETPIPVFFLLMRDLVKSLSMQAVQPLSVLAFELKLLEETGQAPELDSVSLDPETKQTLCKLTHGSWIEIAQLQVSPAQKQKISSFLHGFLIYHLGKIPAGRSAALGEILLK